MKKVIISKKFKKKYLGPLVLAVAVAILITGTIASLLLLNRSKDIRSQARRSQFPKNLAHIRGNDTFSRYTDYELLAAQEKRNKKANEKITFDKSILKNHESDVKITRNVMVINFDPILENYGNRKLHEFVNGVNPKQNEKEYIDAIKKVSGGYVNYQIVENIEVDAFPTKADGFTYSDESYVDCYQDSTRNRCHRPDVANYEKIIATYNICDRVNQGQIDEVWLWGNAYFGFWEAIMIGPEAYNLVGPSIFNNACQKRIAIMGFNYDANLTYGFMLHSLGHRVESTMRNIYRGSRYNYAAPGKSAKTTWDQFSTRAYDVNKPIGCGHVHGHLTDPSFDGNSDVGDTFVADYANPTIVDSNCDAWYAFPFFSLKNVTSVSCSIWNCGGTGFQHYFLLHIPNKPGSKDGKLNNWWKYVVEYNNPENLPDTTYPTRSLDPPPPVQ